MWIRGKHDNGQWAHWEWDPGIDLHLLTAVREKVGSAFKAYCQAYPDEMVVRGSRPRIEAPIGFTPNDFVRRVVDGLPWRGQLTVDFFNIRYFFQTIQVANGTYETGPQEPFKRLANVMAKCVPDEPR